MLSPTYLFRRDNGIFYFRLVIPKKAHKYNSNLPKEIRRSLKTRSKTTALKLSRELLVLIHRLFKLIENNNMNNNSVHILDRIDDYLKTEAAEIQFNCFADMSYSECREFLQDIFIDIAKADLVSFIKTDFPNINELHDHALDIKYARYKKEIDQIKQSSLNSHPVNINSIDLPSETKTNKISFDELMTKFIQYKQDIVRDKTLQQIIDSLNLFKCFIGNTKLEDINKDIIKNYISDLKKYPTNKAKNKKLINLSFKEIISRSSNQPHLSWVTIKRHLSNLNSFFKWSMDMDYIDDNPVQTPFKYFKKKVKSSKSTDCFTYDEISKIFDTGTYLQSVNFKLSRFWIPIIALYTGARQNEIAALTKYDFKNIDNIAYIKIEHNKYNNRKLKNQSSKRPIPIHKHLIELGLLEYIQRFKKDSDYIFPDIPNIKTREDKSHTIGNWWRRYLLKLKIKTSGKNFHSFRSTFITELRKREVSDSNIIDLAGHSQNAETFMTYGKNQSIQILKTDIDKLDYGFDVSALKNKWQAIYKRYKKTTSK